MGWGYGKQGVLCLVSFQVKSIFGAADSTVKESTKLPSKSATVVATPPVDEEAKNRESFPNTVTKPLAPPVVASRQAFTIRRSCQRRNPQSPRKCQKIEAEAKAKESKLSNVWILLPPKSNT